MQSEFGRYRLIRHLATGGMGEVYLAEAKGAAGFAKKVVIKTVRSELSADPELVRQFVAEGRLLEALDHPNIAQILDLGLVNGTYFLAIEMVEGFDLRALQKALPELQPGLPPRMTEVATLYLIACVGRALHHAASRRGPDGKPLSIVHHDVTPSNVMVRRDGHVKLVDFGVARSALLNRLSAGALRGKLPYLSPEHARQLPVDARADLFALGLVAWEMLTGERVLEVGDPDSLEQAYAQLPGKVEALRLSGLASPETVELIADMTRVEVDLRCADAEEVAQRADRRLIALDEASPARTLAQELDPAFRTLEARAQSFDQLLAQTLGFQGMPMRPPMEGTVSLPGLEVVNIAASSARDEPAAAPMRRRGRKRLATAALIALALAGGLGWWFGARRSPEPAPLSATTAAAKTARSGSVGGGAASSRVAVVPPTRVGPVQTPSAGNARPNANLRVAVGLPDEASAAAVGADDRSGVRKGRERQSGDATIKFRVLPANCIVTVDGERYQPGRDNRYEIPVRAGVPHRVRVTDPSSHEVREVDVPGLERGAERSLQAFMFGTEFRQP